MAKFASPLADSRTSLLHSHIRAAELWPYTFANRYQRGVRFGYSVKMLGLSSKVQPNNPPLWRARAPLTRAATSSGLRNALFVCCGVRVELRGVRISAHDFLDDRQIPVFLIQTRCVRVADFSPRDRARVQDFSRGTSNASPTFSSRIIADTLRFWGRVSIAERNTSPRTIVAAVRKVGCCVPLRRRPRYAPPAQSGGGVVTSRRARRVNFSTPRRA